jgi:hypothetical protein
MENIRNRTPRLRICAEATEIQVRAERRLEELLAKTGEGRTGRREEERLARFLRSTA